MDKNKLISIVLNLSSFGIQLLISLVITPMIIGKLGASAYGFIGLANDFIIYLSLITQVLNSVSGRFIAIALCENHIIRANEYFNSVLMVNMILASVFLAVGILFIPNLELFLDIPANLVVDVKVTFSLTLLAYLLNIVVSLYSTATFVKDRLDIQGIRNIVQYTLRGGIVLALYSLLPVKIYWMSLSVLLVTFFISIFDICVFKKLVPELKINIKNFRRNAIFELFSSGGLLAISNLSGVLLTGFDLLIANRLLGSYNMGLLSTAKTLPVNISSAVVIVASLFTPTFIRLYSQNDIHRLKSELCTSMKMIAFVLFVPLTGFMVFSYDFYSLWLQSSQDEILLITLLSDIIVIESFFNAVSFPLAQISLVTNKLYLPVTVSFSIGLANIVIVFVLLKTTQFGLFAIASVSTILLVLRYIFFNPWYASHILGIDPKDFYKMSVKLYCTIPVLAILFQYIKHCFMINSWKDFAVSVCLAGGIGYILMYILLYVRRKNQRKRLDP